MRRGLPDERGFEPRCVSSHRAALSAPSKRWGGPCGPERAVASWNLSTHRQSLREQTSSARAIVALAVGNGAVMRNDEEMESC
jgi:hypothetical protein